MQRPLAKAEKKGINRPERRQGPCLFQLLAASGCQKLLQTVKRSAFQPASIKFIGAKTIQNHHKHIID
jgi:hypothetical protein